MTRLLVLASFALSAFDGSTADAYCGPSNSLKPGIVSPSGIDVARDGGIVVAAVSTFDPAGALPAGDPAQQPLWRIRAGGTTQTPSLTTLAPGLVVYRPIASAGRVDLVDDHGDSIAWVRATKAQRAVLAAPVATRARVDVGVGFTFLEVELAAQAPKTAIALVVADASGTPRSWSLVARGSKIQRPYVQNKCEVVPNGSVLSAPGDVITLFWVDNAGRTSPASAPIQIAP